MVMTPGILSSQLHVMQSEHLSQQLFQGPSANLGFRQAGRPEKPHIQNTNVDPQGSSKTRTRGAMTMLLSTKSDFKNTLKRTAGPGNEGLQTRADCSELGLLTFSANPQLLTPKFLKTILRKGHDVTLNLRAEHKIIRTPEKELTTEM